MALRGTLLRRRLRKGTEPGSGGGGTIHTGVVSATVDATVSTSASQIFAGAISATIDATVATAAVAIFAATTSVTAEATVAVESSIRGEVIVSADATTNLTPSLTLRGTVSNSADSSTSVSGNVIRYGAVSATIDTTTSVTGSYWHYGDTSVTIDSTTVIDGTHYHGSPMPLTVDSTVSSLPSSAIRRGSVIAEVDASTSLNAVITIGNKINAVAHAIVNITQPEDVMPDPIVEVVSWRWRNDDGSETAATWKAATNTSVTNTAGTNVRLRIGIKKHAGTGYLKTSNFNRLEYTRTTDSDVVGQATDSAPVSTTSTYFTNGDATTQQITSGSFVAGEIREVNNNISVAWQTTGDEYTELEWVFQPGTSDRGDTIQTFYLEGESKNTLLGITGNYYHILPAPTIDMPNHRYSRDNLGPRWECIEMAVMADDGSEAASSIIRSYAELGQESFYVPVLYNVNYRIRYRLRQRDYFTTDIADTAGMTLSTGYAGDMSAATSTYITNGEATTNRLPHRTETGSGGSFVSGKAVEGTLSTGTITGPFNWGDETEVEFCVKFNYDAVYQDYGDNISLILSTTGGDTISSGTAYAINVTGYHNLFAGQDITRGKLRYDNGTEITAEYIGQQVEFSTNSPASLQAGEDFRYRTTVEPSLLANNSTSSATPTVLYTDDIDLTEIHSITTETYITQVHLSDDATVLVYENGSDIKTYDWVSGAWSLQDTMTRSTATPGTCSGINLYLAISGDGTVLFTSCYTPNPDYDTRITEWARSGGGGWTYQREFVTQTGNQNPKITSDYDGNTIVIWYSAGGYFDTYDKSGSTWSKRTQTYDYWLSYSTPQYMKLNAAGDELFVFDDHGYQDKGLFLRMSWNSGTSNWDADWGHAGTLSYRGSQVPQQVSCSSDLNVVAWADEDNDGFEILKWDSTSGTYRYLAGGKDGLTFPDNNFNFSTALDGDGSHFVGWNNDIDELNTYTVPDNWTEVGAAGTTALPIVYKNSSNITNGQATTDQLGAYLFEDNLYASMRQESGDTAYTAGKCYEDNAQSISLVDTKRTDLEACLTTVSSNVTTGDIYYLQQVFTNSSGVTNLMGARRSVQAIEIQNSGSLILESSDFIWRNNDGSEVAATQFCHGGSQALRVQVGQRLRLRVAVRDVGAASGTSTVRFALQWSGNNSSWAYVQNNSSYVRYSDSGYITNLEATTQQISTGTFKAGQVIDSGTWGNNITSFGSNNVTEMEFSLYFVSEPIVDHIYLRLIENTLGGVRMAAMPVIDIGPSLAGVPANRFWELQQTAMRVDDGTEVTATYINKDKYFSQLDTAGWMQWPVARGHVFRYRWAAKEFTGFGRSAAFSALYNSATQTTNFINYGDTNSYVLANYYPEGSQYIDGTGSTTQQLTTGAFTEGDIVEGAYSCLISNYSAGDTNENEILLVVDDPGPGFRETTVHVRYSTNSNYMLWSDWHRDSFYTSDYLYKQYAYRFRNEDGTEATATWYAAQDTNVNMFSTEKFRLRIGIQSWRNFHPVVGNFRLQYSENYGTWTNVPSSGTTGHPVTFNNTGSLTDFGKTTQQLTGGSGTFNTTGRTYVSNIGDFYYEGVIDFYINEYAEFEYSLRLISGEVDPATVLRFRMVSMEGTPALDRNGYPTILVERGSLPDTYFNQFRGVNDNNYENSPSWKAPANVGWDQLIGSKFRARWDILNTVAGLNPPIDVDYKIQYNANLAGTFSDDLKFTGTSTGDEYGEGVAISGDGLVMAIGAPAINTVYIKELVAGTWIQRITVTSTGSTAGDDFGASVALDYTGSTLYVGCPKETDTLTEQGVVRIFDQGASITQWTERSYFRVAGDLHTSQPAAANDHFGTSVSCSATNDILAVGAPHRDYDGSNLDSGAVYIYEFLDNYWYDGGYAATTTGGWEWGHGVALSTNGLSMGIGAPGYNTDNGLIYFADKTAPLTWTLRSNGLGGSNSGERFGDSIAMDNNGRVCIVGAPNYTGGSSAQGRVYVVDWDGKDDGANYTNRQSIDCPDVAVNAHWGSDVAIASVSERFLGGESGDNTATGAVYTLDVSLTWTDVPSQVITTSPVRYANSAYITDGEVTTQQLSTGDFDAGSVAESANPGGTITDAASMEVEYVLEPYSPTVQDKDVVRFRVLDIVDAAKPANQDLLVVTMYDTLPIYGQVSAVAECTVIVGQTHEAQISVTAEATTNVEVQTVANISVVAEATTAIKAVQTHIAKLSVGPDPIGVTIVGRVAERGIVDATFGTRLFTTGRLILNGSITSPALTSIIAHATNIVNGQVSASIDTNTTIVGTNTNNAVISATCNTQANVTGRIFKEAAVHARTDILSNVVGDLTFGAKCGIIIGSNVNIIATNEVLASLSSSVDSSVVVSGTIIRNAVTSSTSEVSTNLVAYIERSAKILSEAHTFVSLDGTIQTGCALVTTTVLEKPNTTVVNEKLNITTRYC